MSGIGRYLQGLLPALVPRLNAKRIIALGRGTDLGAEAWAKDSRVDVRTFEYPIFGAAEQLPSATSIYREAEALWVPQYNIPLFYRGKLVVTLHDLCHLALPETLRTHVQRWYSRRLLTAVANRADVLLCVSQFTAKEVERFLNVTPDRILVTYPPIADNWARASDVKEAHTPKPYLLFVGNQKKNKNLVGLIGAFRQVMHRIPHHLVLVGKRDGFLNFDTEIDFSDVQLHGRVLFVGQVSEQELRMYYRGADALIFPSLYEGFGFPLVEAMLHGCPIACSNASSLPEVAGDAALYFNPVEISDMAKAIYAVVTDIGLRAILIQNGYARVRRFTNDSGAVATALAMNNLVGQHLG
ncbi:glycosyltransferase family 4 protein [Alloacidobacterium dinghuense]|uniref:Glycosyltransferase family 4 protein n=1 Tax=Alloacidobacterium dinghuense TaxID=2763107 RepID=A0A7G8BGA2_9BACT|nr:glycosyltransferase family 1 protein [Alloacidobacterium dinghuense]QNI31572.1 glycosyltransferase family 4 protein [Alloacidobacterium dinghuense]